MKPQKDMRKLGELIQSSREQAGLSARKLEQISGLDHSYISKLERGAYQSVLPDNLNKLAEALDISAADLFTLAGYPAVDELPSFGPYLRTRYGEELPADARAALTEMFEVLSRSQGSGAETVDDEEPESGFTGRTS